MKDLGIEGKPREDFESLLMGASVMVRTFNEKEQHQIIEGSAKLPQIVLKNPSLRYLYEPLANFAGIYPLACRQGG